MGHPPRRGVADEATSIYRTRPAGILGIESIQALKGFAVTGFFLDVLNISCICRRSSTQKPLALGRSPFIRGDIETARPPALREGGWVQLARS